MSKTNKVGKVYQRVIPEHDFLKYWRVVRFWAKAKYKLSQEDLELLIFLYGSPTFTNDDFNMFNGTMNWDPPRFKNLKRDGWIKKWRNANSKSKALYHLSYKGKKIVRSVYRKLLGEEHISEDRRRNPVFDKGQYCYAHTMYGRIMKYMNEEFKTVREYKEQYKEREL